MNQFLLKSRFEVTAAYSSSGKTFIEDSFFTSPFKIMKPFEKEDGGIFLYLQSSSPGLLEDDSQNYKIHVKKNASLEIRSQSFEKIFKMDKGKKAEREIQALVEDGATLIYSPLPCIPFSQSNFSSTTEISLSKNSRLIYEDCICAGRCMHGEAFDFTLYQNLINIKRQGKLIFRDNLFLEGSDGNQNPKAKEILFGKTMFDNFTHCGNMLIFGFSNKLMEIRKSLGLQEKLLYTEENLKSLSDSNKNSLIEINENDSGDLIIRCLANKAEVILKQFENIRSLLK